MKVFSPEITNIAEGQGFHYLEASSEAGETVRPVAPCRGLSPWQANERYVSELGRAMPLSKKKEAPNELKRQVGSMAARQSDWLIVGE